MVVDPTLSPLAWFARHLLAAVVFASLVSSSPAADSAEPPITSIAFTPDGHSVVVGSQAGLAVHDWPDLNLQKQVDTKLVNVHDLAFSPNGEWLAVAGGPPSEEGLVEVFAWPSGESSFTLEGHDDSVLAVDWKDDHSLATASLDHEVVLWNVATGEQLQRLKGHSRGVTSVCFLPGQPLLVSGGIDQNLRVWNLESAEVIRTLNNHTKEVNDLACRPVSQGLPMIASVSNDRTVRLWQPTIGRMVRFAQLNSPLLAVAWLPDGSLVAVASADGHVRLIDPDTVAVIADFVAFDGWAYSLAAHPSDGSLLVGGRNGQLKRIVLDTSKPLSSR